MVSGVSGSNSNKSSNSVSNQKSNTSNKTETKGEAKSESPKTAKTSDIAPSSDALKEGRLDALTDAQDDARHNKEFRPRDGNTYCNMAVTKTLKDIGVDVNDPKAGLVDPEDKSPNLANDMADNLAESAKEKDGFWKQVDAEGAQELANDGYPVVGALKREGKHGHVVTVRPEGYDKGITRNDGDVLSNNIGSSMKVMSDSRPYSFYTPRSYNQ